MDVLGKDYTSSVAEYVEGNANILAIIREFQPAECDHQLAAVNAQFRASYVHNRPMNQQTLVAKLYVDNLCFYFETRNSHHLPYPLCLQVSVRYYSKKYESGPYSDYSYIPTNGVIDIYGVAPQCSVGVEIPYTYTYTDSNCVYINMPDFKNCLKALRESCMFCGRAPPSGGSVCVRCLSRHNTTGCMICHDTAGVLVGRDECLGRCIGARCCRYHAVCWVEKFKNTSGITERAKYCEICRAAFKKRMR